MANRVIIAVGEHIITQQALSGRSKCIGVEESADVCIVISALQIIKPGLSVVDVAGRGYWASDPAALRKPSGDDTKSPRSCFTALPAHPMRPDSPRPEGRGDFLDHNQRYSVIQGID